MIELKNIHKNLGGRTILNGINLHIKNGETFVIVGPSGTGKSVTLKHILGLFTPDRGQVIINSKNICKLNNREMEPILNKFGVLFQSGALINWMNVYDNIALPLLEKTDLGTEEIQKLVSEKLEMVGLSGIETKMPAELSGGMKKRVGLARAIIRNPEIILYDEPTSGLDPVLSRSIDKLIINLQKQLQVTSVVVTHDLVSAFAIADRIAMLHSGVVIEVATPEQFKQSQNPLIKEFIISQFGREIWENIK